jgi:hypothetical protein
MARQWLCLVIGIIAVLTTGCVQLLPRSHSEVVTRWNSFADAQAVVDGVVPYRTTKADLRTAGIDPAGDPAVTLLSHVDVAMRFPIGGVLRAEDVDIGIRACMAAGKQCNGYLLSVKRVDRKRVGNFWIDSLRFKRVTEVTGWSFNATVLFVGDLAVYAVYGGQPLIHEVETETNPLGPLQGWGDSLGSQLTP